MSNLILTRKAGESVKIGDKMMTVEHVNRANIDVSFDGEDFGNWRLGQTVTSKDKTVSINVTSIARGYAKLTFTADHSIIIVRSELLK